MMRTTIYLALGAFIATAIAMCGMPVPAQETIQDEHGQTKFVIRPYPTGHQRMIQDPNGRTRFVLKPDPYSNDETIQDTKGKRLGRWTHDKSKSNAQ